MTISSGSEVHATGPVVGEIMEVVVSVEYNEESHKLTYKTRKVEVLSMMDGSNDTTHEVFTAVEHTNGMDV